MWTKSFSGVFCVHFAKGEMAAWADGVVEVDFLVACEGAFFLEDDVLQEVH